MFGKHFALMCYAKLDSVGKQSWPGTEEFIRKMWGDTCVHYDLLMYIRGCLLCHDKKICV